METYYYIHSFQNTVRSKNHLFFTFIVFSDSKHSIDLFNTTWGDDS